MGWEGFTIDERVKSIVKMKAADSQIYFSNLQICGLFYFPLIYIKKSLCTHTIQHL